MSEETIDGTPEEPQGHIRPARRWWRHGILGRHRAQLITDARRSPVEDLHHRERVYAWIQASRIPLIIVALLLYWWWGNIWLSGGIFFISIPLPWIAVVIANLRGEPRDPRAPKVYKPALAREQAEWELEQTRAAALGAAPDEADNLPDVIDHSDPTAPSDPSSSSSKGTD
ncbi:DUF3099 domain-containing protein [Corynebacterium uropygiale]|uniref:DUF3099 domain-containing protein n=1 Tax=Corynebacterium uropygiale TaxID=1775911 RepID=A0A9X1QN88_9CORY|nr:DUF3099 domain-containing protein [Corynebacterium uropygiale]MCF4006492.1 DUF3099 domain-containing protein [Corynebacterium uropygiale]